MLLNLLNYGSVFGYIRYRLVSCQILSNTRHRSYPDCIFFIRNWLENRKIPFEQRIKHAKDLNKIYKKLACVWIGRPHNDSFVFKVPEDPDHYHVYGMMAGFGVEEPRDTDVQHLTNLDWALCHLKKYRRIYKPWKQANNKLDKLNTTLSNDIDNKLDDIDILLKQFRKELEVLITHIEAGAILKGKCPIGY